MLTLLTHKFLKWAHPSMNKAHPFTHIVSVKIKKQTGKLKILIRWLIKSCLIWSYIVYTGVGFGLPG